ncbi:MAG: hypothetical protein KDD62_14770, partial [Bdellovibrionales bacterium]|nr:hypothetical protein [Bdellovibrionales bacterium]
MKIAETQDIGPGGGEREFEAACVMLVQLKQALSAVPEHVLDNGINDTLGSDRVSTLVSFSQGEKLSNLKQALNSVEDQAIGSL